MNTGIDWPGYGKTYSVHGLGFDEVIVPGAFGEVSEDDLRKQLFTESQGFEVLRQEWEEVDGGRPVRRIIEARLFST